MVHSKSTTPADYLLLGLFTVWLIFGLVMLTSASTPSGYSAFGDKYFFIKRQLMYGVAPGTILYIITSRLRFSIFKTLAFPGFVISILLLIAVLIPGIGSTLNTGSRSWLSFGGFTVQPAEFAKLGMIIFLAAHLAIHKEAIRNMIYGFGKSLLLGIIPVFLIIWYAFCCRSRLSSFERACIACHCFYGRVDSDCSVSYGTSHIFS